MSKYKVGDKVDWDGFGGEDCYEQVVTIESYKNLPVIPGEHVYYVYSFYYIQMSKTALVYAENIPEEHLFGMYQ